MEAKLGSNPSYVWRSVLVSHGLLQRGLRWRIGIGSNVNVWTNPWLPDQFNPFFESQMVTGLQHVIVDSLIGEDGTNWDLDILDELFNEREKNLICQIPLSRVSKSIDYNGYGIGKGCIL